MGDMADWINDNGFWSELTNEEPKEPSLVKCRNCKEDNLYWWRFSVYEKWRLYNKNNKLHNCPIKPLIE